MTKMDRRSLIMSFLAASATPLFFGRSYLGVYIDESLPSVITLNDDNDDNWRGLFWQDAVENYSDLPKVVESGTAICVLNEDGAVVAFDNTWNILMTGFINEQI